MAAKKKKKRNGQKPKLVALLPPFISLRNSINMVVFAFKFPDMKRTQSDGTMRVDKGRFCHPSSLTKVLQLILRNHLHQLANEFGHGSPRVRAQQKATGKLSNRGVM